MSEEESSQLPIAPFLYNGQPKVEIPPNVSCIQVDETVTVIPENGFSDFAFLIAVEFHPDVQRIGESAFIRCRALQAISIPPKVNMIDTATFGLCSSLVDVSLVDGLKVIGDSCFFQCNSLTRISIPKTVTQINSNAFGSCRALSKVELQEGSLFYILDGAFSGCVSLKFIHIPSTVLDFGSHAFSGSGLVDIGLPSKLRSIDESAFQSCKSLERIFIPDTVSTIYLWAFAHCCLLRVVELKEGLQSIFDGAFNGCKALEAIQIPSTCMSIGKRSFHNCEALVDIHLHEGLRSIGDSAFGRCTSLSGISIPSTVITVGKLAFQECNRLLGVAIPPDSDMEIGVEMFEYCTNLVTVSIPSTIDYIPEDAFSGCPLFEDNTSSEGEDLPESLKDRFESLPIHKMCYYPTSDALISSANLDSISESNEYSVDAFGMTPLHIIATSGHLLPYLVVAVLDKYPPDILWRKDRHEKTAMDYLLWNGSPRVFPLIQIILERMIAASLGPYCLEEWKGALFIQAESVATSDFSARSVEYNEFCRLKDEYWKMEAVSVLELALWNKRMGPDPISSEDRAACHALCGTDSVIPNVVRYL